MGTGPILPPPVIHNDANTSQSHPRHIASKEGPLQTLRAQWARLKKLNRGTLPADYDLRWEDGFALESFCDPNPEPIDDAQFDTKPVDEIIVDRVWSEDVKSSASPSESNNEYSASTQIPTTTIGDYANAMSGSTNAHVSRNPFLTFRHRIYPAVISFFNPTFKDPKVEAHYRQESWFFKKPLARWAAVWLIFNWALGCLFGHSHGRSFRLIDVIFFFGVAPAFSIPVIFFVMTNLASEQPIWYQVYLSISVWMWPIFQVLYMYLCGFFTNHPQLFPCDNRAFLDTFYFATAMQTIALFGLNMRRLPALLGALCFIIISTPLLGPEYIAWWHFMINVFVYHAFLIYLHYMSEIFERRYFFLRDRLKEEFRATQRAQINERKSADSKRRLTSYVFHEVRVPLNTALLAVQNMSARRDMIGTCSLPKDQDIEFSALEGSLSMMSKVLNDVLDFDRMDSGRFEQASSPYAFHQTMRSLLVPLRLATQARRLDLVVDLDPQIDIVARRAAYEAIGGELPDVVEKHIKENPDVDGVVIGDETRLRQIVTNLASNGCKFTQAGGKLTIKTRLVLPSKDNVPDGSTPSNSRLPYPLSSNVLDEHEHDHSSNSSTELDRIVVRIEVSDTGYGISQTEMIRGRLFSPFNQTEQGRQQGGKGTGLGLALVRQIVKLSGGRLGVKSAKGEGSMFWVELPLGIGRKTLPKVTETIAENSLDYPDGQPGSIDSHRLTSEEYTLPMADAAASIATRPVQTSIRSSSALHGLMDQGGWVELKLSAEDHSPVPTRTIGDASTGTQVCGIAESLGYSSGPGRHSYFHVPSTSKAAPAPPTTPVCSSTSASRPQFVHLPLTPPTFTLDSDQTPSSEQSTPDLASDGRTSMFEVAKLNVLVVDDDLLTRTLMTRLLQRLGCTVTTAENGQIALRHLHASLPSTPESEGPLTPLSVNLESLRTPFADPDTPSAIPESDALQIPPFDLVFLDNSMPVMTGLETVTRLRGLGRKDFVVGVTGNALLTDQKQYLEAGANHVLTKPVYEKSLKEILTIAEQLRKQYTSFL